MIVPLIRQLFSLFLMILIGAVTVRVKLLKPEDSVILSKLTLYVVIPCVIVMAFQIDCTDETRGGFLLALLAAVIIQAGLILIMIPLGKLLHLSSLEKASVIYMNCGNLIIPLVMSVLGPDWVIYSSAYAAVQMVALWSHAAALMAKDRPGERLPRKKSLKKIFLNVNLIAIYIGAAFFFTGIRFPSLISDTMNAIGALVGPLSMFIIGMVIGGQTLKQVFSYRRVWLTAFLRLIVTPLLILVFLKYSGIAHLAANGRKVLFITLLAVSAPTASMINQFAIVNDNDPEYSSAINFITMLLSLVTMPLMAWIYLR